MSTRTPLSPTQVQQYSSHIQLLAPALDLLSDHVIITDENANILYANPATEKHTGFNRREIIGENPGDLWGGQMDREFYANMWHTIKIEKRPFAGEVRNRRKDGTRYWQELRVTPILNESGDIKFFIRVEPNITSRKEREIFKEEFVALIGHQLKNALTKTSWTLESILKQDPPLPAKEKQAIQEIYEENKRFGDLVHDLLVLARLQSNHFKKDRIDLAEEIERLLAVFQEKYPKVQYSIKNGGKCLLNTYKALASQVFLNIIANAFEYSNYSKKGKIAISLKKEKATYVFYCKDNGIGIPKEEQKQIFTQFYRATNAAEMKKEGTGLGLFIANTIATSLNWKISLHSQISKGTEVCVTIPIKEMA
ncbi:MAG: PAS domain S-box protein [Candidatus Wildermuthbacteria bacterium]|nr:PAS domain S-box protein [Candidatus Wildermuthbacteria bacterium]